jgi:hypothetical protein
MLVSPEVDSLCTSRILALLFKCYGISYKIRCVGGYDDVASVNAAEGKLKTHFDVF